MLISKGQLDRIYIGTSKLYLWRSLHKNSKSRNPLYPDFEEREIRARVLRVPNVETITLPKGVEIVQSTLGQRTSLFDRPGAFG